jgi:hypothetical protein
MRLTATFALAVVVLLSGTWASADDRLPPGFNPKRHMLVREVEPGMVGFGHTVFRGVEIDRFEVEVISVERGFRAGKSVVWIRCTDERMQRIGPVSGMSGSPIFLYPKGMEKAGPSAARMIGAFAYGYGGGNGRDCYAGVQPIEQMLYVAARGKASVKNGEPSAKVGGDGKLISLGLKAAEQQNLPASVTWRLERLAELLDIQAADDKPAAASPAGRMGRNTMSLPLMVATTRDAELLSPFFKPQGITPLAANATGPTGLPPQWIAPDQVKPTPGGVLSIPLMTGDMDMPAVGTITEVLPDGTVLAFGHSFEGRGPLRVPMATGFVHFIQPSDRGSFKLGGTLRVIGSVVNDEVAAISGTPKVKSAFKPSKVQTIWPDGTKSRTFNYQIAEHKYYTPLLAGYSVAMSVGSDTELPEHVTLRMTGKLKFDQGKTIDLDMVAPNGTSEAVLYQIYPIIAALNDTPYGELKFEGIEATVTVQEKVMAAEITNVTVRNTTVAPGDQLKVNLEIKPFRGEPVNHLLKLKIPDDQPDGPFNVMVGDANSYVQMLYERKPHLTRVNNIDELFEMVKMISTIKQTAVYATLLDQRRPQVAIGRTELPDLPSSKAAMLLQPTSSQATPYIDAVEYVEPIDYVIQGNFSFPILVQSQPEAGS